MKVNVDQLIVTKLGLWRLRVNFMDLIKVPGEGEEDGIPNFNFYASSFTQSEEEVAKTNQIVDAPYRKDRTTAEEFVDLVAEMCTGLQLSTMPF